MASCLGCKKRTTSFCYVHKSSICDDCIVTPVNSSLQLCECNCYISNYFDWLSDNEFEWPPKCLYCNRIITNQPSQSLRTICCKQLLHAECLATLIAKEAPNINLPANNFATLRCMQCNAPLYDPQVQTKSKLRERMGEFIKCTLLGHVFLDSSRADPNNSLSNGPVSKIGLNSNESSTNSALSHAKITTGTRTRTAAANPADHNTHPSNSAVDIEAQPLLPPTKGKSKQKFGKFGPANRRKCRPERYIIIIMLAALFLSVLVYFYYTTTLISNNNLRSNDIDNSNTIKESKLPGE
jgi:hypothetical protein